MGFRRLLSQLRRISARQPAPRMTSAPTGRRTALMSVTSEDPVCRPVRQANWLDDALRLRPARRARTAVPLSATTMQPLESRRAEVVAGTGYLASETSETDRPKRANEITLAEVAPPLRMPTTLASATPASIAGAEASDRDADATTGDDQLDALEGMDAVQRRLVLIRYLVRQRVYNEGFSPDATPEQYRWSTTPQTPPVAE